MKPALYLVFGIFTAIAWTAFVLIAAAQYGYYPPAKSAYHADHHDAAIIRTTWY